MGHTDEGIVRINKHNKQEHKTAALIGWVCPWSAKCFVYIILTQPFEGGTVGLSGFPSHAAQCSGEDLNLIKS